MVHVALLLTIFSRFNSSPSLASVEKLFFPVPEARFDG